MARSPARTAEGTADALERVALHAFYEVGYHGASIRDIAGRGGVGVATVFHHFPNKAAILERIMNRAVDQMDAELHAGLDGLEDPREVLATAVRILVLAHCQRQEQSFVAQSELRSLEPDERAKVRAKRARVQGLLIEAIEQGVAAGHFECAQPREAAHGIVAMATTVANWYRPNGPRSAEDIADDYADFARRMLQPRLSADGTA